MDSRPETAYTQHDELFADEFRRGRSYTTWRPHGTTDWLLIYTEAGSGRFATPAGTHETQPGEAVLLAPGEQHDYTTARDHWHLLWAHFVPPARWQPWLKWPVQKGLRVLRLDQGEVRERFRAAMTRTIRMGRRKLPGARELAVNGLEEALLWANVSASKDPWLTLDPRVRKAIDHMGANLGKPFRLGELARHCGTSVSRLAYVFKRETGTSPRQYLEQQRLLHAARLLRMTGLGVAEIAGEAGFADPFYFSNRFRKFAGVSPTEFRGREN